MEITRKTLAMPVAAFVTGAISGFKTAAPLTLGAGMTIVCWAAGYKKTAVMYAALTAGCAARMISGAEKDAEADEEFYESLHDKIAGPDEPVTADAT